MIEPILAMVSVTACVWLYMYFQRIPYLLSHKIDLQLVRTPDAMTSLLTEKVQLPAYNLRNLFELPVLFYVLCLVAIFLDINNSLMINLAWSYVLLRAIHSIIHCTYNHVMHRFIAYFLSSLVLWIMLIDLILYVF